MQDYFIALLCNISFQIFHEPKTKALVPILNTVAGTKRG